jgi:GT2 family glycosyltransferase
VTTEASAPQHAEPMVRVVVVNFDGGDITLRCLDALRATEYPHDRLQIVVVDNGSVDGLERVIPERFPEVTVIRSATNEGFARGCNLAMRDLAGIAYVALINNDAVVAPDWLRPLLAGFTHSTVGAVCPKLLLNVDAHVVLLQPERLSTLADGRTVGVRVQEVDIDDVDRTSQVRFDERFWPVDEPLNNVERGMWSKGTAALWWPAAAVGAAERVTVHVAAHSPTTALVGPPEAMSEVQLGSAAIPVHCTTDRAMHIINSAGGALFSGWSGGDRGYLEPDLGQYDAAQEVFAWSGGAVLLSATYLREVGLFDPTFFLYYEDFDLSWRGRSAGWTYRYEPASVVFHEHAHSSNVGSRFFTFWVDRNRRLTLVKNAPAKVAVRAAGGAMVSLVRDLVRHVAGEARTGRPPSVLVVKRRTVDFWSFARALPSACRERRRLAGTRVVPHRVIASWMQHK